MMLFQDGSQYAWRSGQPPLDLSPLGSEPLGSVDSR